MTHVDPPHSIKAFASRAPSRAPQVARRTGGYTLLIIPGESGTPWRFQLRRSLITWMICILFAGIGALGAVLVDYTKLQIIVHDYERLRAENHSIRSEAAAIIARLDGVQSALNRMDNFSTQIREMSKPESSCKGPRCKNLKPKNDDNKNTKKDGKPQGNIPTQKSDRFAANVNNFENVGPVSKEDYFLSRSFRAKSLNNEPSVNFRNLEFRDAFERLLKVGTRSESQARELERLLGDVKDYQKKLANTPTLAPAIGYVSSGFGDRESPFSGHEAMHWGLDIAASIGTTVYAAAAGVVVDTRYLEDYGKVIDVDHGSGIRTRYAHLNKVLVKKGDKIVKGDIIAEVGNTGRSTGPHLHYEVEINGKRVDPIKYIHEW